MKYSLRSLMIVTILAPPLLAWGIITLPNIVNEIGQGIRTEVARLKRTIWPPPPVRVILLTNSGSMRIPKSKPPPATP